ncbi:MAG: septum formation initiator family protein [Oscillospiraceae bacterium]|nr:septum formation initiator family protein [Oscillospiraceae bacterium]
MAREKGKTSGYLTRQKKNRSKLIIIALVLFLSVLSLRTLSLWDRGEAEKETAEILAEAEYLQKENQRLEDELRQRAQGGEVQHIIERIARQLGLIYPGERVFKDRQ